MAEQLSKISTILQELGKVITTDEERFLDIPIYYGMIELIADNMPTTAVVFETLPFIAENNCEYQRQLDIIIIHNTDYEREIILRLSKYAEDMVELMNLNGVDYGQDALWPVFNKRRNRE